MTEDDFNKAPLLDQILYDCTGMLVKNHPAIKESMQKYADQQLILSSVGSRRRLLDDFYNKLDDLTQGEFDELSLTEKCEKYLFKN